MKRKCGACTLCCTALAVPELGKKNGERCQHLTPTGCGIYEDRPPSCRAFECLWLQGDGDPSVRPDRLGAVLTAEDGRVDTVALVIYPRPGDDRFRRSKYLTRLVARLIKKGSGAFVMDGEKRTLFTAPGSRLAQKLAELQKEDNER